MDWSTIVSCELGEILDTAVAGDGSDRGDNGSGEEEAPVSCSGPVLGVTVSAESGGGC